MDASYVVDLRKARALIGGGCPGPEGPTGPQGPGVSPLYASFQSNTTQDATTVNPVAITYSERTIGTIDVVGGTFPNSSILIPTSGVYKILFSAQCDTINGTHYLEIFPVVDGVSVPNSNTRIALTAPVESCLTVEYFLSLNANQVLQIYMIADSTNSRLLALSRGGGTPSVPDIPSIILTIMRIA
jgi:hypothetical protein